MCSSVMRRANGFFLFYSDAVAAIAEGYGGTISQHADVQAYLTLRVLRNALDGVDINTGIATPDPAGNVLSDDVYVYRADERSYYALNVAVTSDNYQDFMDSTMVYAPVSNQLDASTSPEKAVWLNIYNSADNFLGSTYQPLLQKYDKLLNLKVDYIGGDGQTESNITNLSLIHISFPYRVYSQFTVFSFLLNGIKHFLICLIP